MFWDGTQWVDERPTPSARGQSRLARWAATGVMLVGAVGLIVPMQFAAAASRKADPGCAINPISAELNQTYVVSAWGLPQGSAVNLWVTHDGVTTGSPLGSTADGTFNLEEASATTGVWTYTFSGPTRKNMTVYGSCSVSVY